MEYDSGYSLRVMKALTNEMFILQLRLKYKHY